MENHLEITEEVRRRVDLSPLDGKIVLITGGSGLLGGHLVTALQMADIELHIVVQHKFEGGIGPYSYLHYANLANESDCARLPNADVVISAASYAQPLRFLAEPLMALRSSAYGLMALLEKTNVGGRFLYISSSEVYCDCLAEPPFKEDDIGTITPYHPRACYITGKMFGEAMTYLYRERGISTVSVRPGIIYGPGVKKGDRRSWAQFIERALVQHQIELMDAGKVRRTFCYMVDGIELILKALLYGRQPVYNISGRSALTIAELAETVGRVVGVPVIYPEEDHGVAGTPMDLQLDTSRIEKEFNKMDYIDIETGMSYTAKWMARLYGD